MNRRHQFCISGPPPRFIKPPAHHLHHLAAGLIKPDPVQGPQIVGARLVVIHGGHHTRITLIQRLDEISFPGVGGAYLGQHRCKVRTGRQGRQLVAPVQQCLGQQALIFQRLLGQRGVIGQQQADALLQGGRRRPGTGRARHACSPRLAPLIGTVEAVPALRRAVPTAESGIAASPPAVGILSALPPRATPLLPAAG